MPNQLLDHLQTLCSRPLAAREVVLPRGERIMAANYRFSYCYFPLSCLITEVDELPDGKCLSVSTTGKDGFTGVPLLFGCNTATDAAVVSLAGAALRVTTRIMRELLTLPEARTALNSYALRIYRERSQTALCTVYHDALQRLARWLVAAFEATGNTHCEATHQDLANYLGLQRPTITVAARQLLAAELIYYRHGRIEINDTAGLKAVACECWDVGAASHENVPLWDAAG